MLRWDYVIAGSPEETGVLTERGLVRDGERAAKIKELEFAMNKRMLMHHLAK